MNSRLSLFKNLVAVVALVALSGCDFIPSSYEYTDKTGNKKTVYLEMFQADAPCAASNKSTECENNRKELAPKLPELQAAYQAAKTLADEASKQLACMKKGNSNAKCGITDPEIKEGDLDAMQKKTEYLNGHRDYVEQVINFHKNPLARIPQYIYLDASPMSCNKYDEYCQGSGKKVQISIPEEIKGDKEKLTAWIKEQVDEYACKIFDICADTGGSTDDITVNGEPVNEIIEQFINQTNQNGVNSQGASGYVPPI